MSCIMIDIVDDLLTRRNGTRVIVDVGAGETLCDVVERIRIGGEGRLAEAAHLAVVVDGVPVEARARGEWILRGGEQIRIAPAPADPVNGVLIGIAIVAAVASSVMAPKVHAPASTGAETPERRLGFARYSNDAVAGDPIPVVLGRLVRHGGKVISVLPGEGPDGDARLKILLDLGEGPFHLIGANSADCDRVGVDVASEIYLNDQPIASIAPDARISVRMGTADQDPIPGFDDTETLHEVGVGGVALRNTDGVDRTGGSASAEAHTYATADEAQAAVIRLRFSRGLYTLTESGQVDVRRIQWRHRHRTSDIGSGAGTWAVWTTETLERAEQNEFYAAQRIDALGGSIDAPPARYDIQVERVTAESESAADIDGFLFDQVVEVVYTENAYPHSALLAIELTANEQLSSVPRVSVLVEGSADLDIWDGESAPSDPEFEAGYSANPAWLALAIIRHTRWGMGSRYGAASVDHASLIAWAAYCDETVDRPGGGTRPRFCCNIVLDRAASGIEWLRTVCRAGRCVPVTVGGVWRFIVDRPQATAVEFFGDGSIAIDDDGVAAFSYSRVRTTGGRSRPNRILVQFANDDEEGRADTRAYPDDGSLWLGGEGAEPVYEEAVRLDGITDPDQAAAEAIYLMKRIRLRSRSIRFRPTRPLVAVQPGERIDVAMSVPAWGLASGRCATGSTDAAVVLDRSVTLGEGVHSIVISHLDGTLETRTIASAAGDYAAGESIALSSALSQAPDFAGAEYSIGAAGQVAKPFLVTRVGIVDAAEARWEIEATEYVEDVYDDDPDELDVPSYSALGGVMQAPGFVQGLAAYERLVGGIRTVQLSWRQTPADARHTASFVLYRRSVGTSTWVSVPGVTPTRRGAIVELADTDRAYQFTVIAVSAVGIRRSPYDPGAPVANIVFGLSAPPPGPPTDGTITRVGSTYTLAWTAAEGAVEYQVLAGGVPGGGRMNDGAVDCLVLARTAETELAGLVLPTGESCTFYVRSVGASGRLSFAAETVTIASPVAPAGETVKETYAADLEHDGTLDNLVWSGGATCLQLDDAAEPGIWQSDDIDTGGNTLSEISIRPVTWNDADDPAIETDPFTVPSIEADQWGIIDTGPPVVGMLMPPWPDSLQTWLFEVRTSEEGTAWSDWEPIVFGGGVRRTLRYYTIRATLSREEAPYRPGLQGLAVVVTH